MFRITAGVAERYRESGFRWGQIGSASLVSLAHGTNDAQKTMGVITLALVATGAWTDLTAVPFWVKLTCALAIALGTYLGGWRIIRTLGKGLVEIASPQGMAAESASAAVILTSSHMGFALSTTHVATGSILGTGLGKRDASVNWRVAGRMLLAWAITLPAAGAVGAAMWFVGHLIGGLLGALVVFGILAASSWAMYQRSKRVPWSTIAMSTTIGSSESLPKVKPPARGGSVMNNLWLALQGAGSVLVVGLALGAGLPALFAVGIRALGWGSGRMADAPDHRPHPVGRAIGYACFAIVALAIVLGVGTIVAHGMGMRLLRQCRTHVRAEVAVKDER